MYGLCSVVALKTWFDLKLFILYALVYICACTIYALNDETNKLKGSICPSQLYLYGLFHVYIHIFVIGSPFLLPQPLLLLLLLFLVQFHWFWSISNCTILQLDYFYSFYLCDLLCRTAWFLCISWLLLRLSFCDGGGWWWWHCVACRIGCVCG